MDLHRWRRRGAGTLLTVPAPEAAQDVRAPSRPAFDMLLSAGLAWLGLAWLGCTMRCCHMLRWNMLTLLPLFHRTQHITAGCTGCRGTLRATDMLHDEEAGVSVQVCHA